MYINKPPLIMIKLKIFFQHFKIIICILGVIAGVAIFFFGITIFCIATFPKDVLTQDISKLSFGLHGGGVFMFISAFVIAFFTTRITKLRDGFKLLRYENFKKQLET